MGTPALKNKLIVIVIIDQMRPESLHRQIYAYDKGFKTLLDNSSYFPLARFNHVPTETAPGHTAIVTGVPPKEHGIVGNDWYEKETQKRINSNENRDGEITPANILVPTLGDRLKEKNPRSKVVAISFKDRAAVMLGGKKADAVIWFDKKHREFTTSPYYANNLAWLKNLNAKLSEEIPWWPHFAKALISPKPDNWVLEMAKEAIHQYQLGKDQDCDLLLVSFSATDNIGHWYGPDGEEMKNQLLNLDAVLAKLLITIAEATDSEFSLILTSDHGVLPVPEEAQGIKQGAKRIDKKELKNKFESAIQEIYPGEPWIFETLIPDIYLNTTRAEKMNISSELFLKNAAQQIKKLDDVAQVYIPPGFIEEDEYTAIYERSYYPKRSGDLYVRLHPGVLPSDSKSGTNHGTAYDYDAVVPLLFFGKEFKSKIFNNHVSMEDIAPTVAVLLNIPLLPSETGRVLTEIFTNR